MCELLARNSEALRLFFTEDIFLVPEPVAEIEERVPKTEEPVREIAEPAAEIKVISSVTVKPDFKYLGKNEKNILILVNDKDNDVSTAEGRDLLTNIVKAINLSGKDFALLNYAKYPGTDFKQLQQFFNARLTFAFGVDAEELNLPGQPLNRLMEYEGRKLIFSANLHKLSGDVASKKVLWTCLKTMEI